jgi:putative ABC transport system substrate-binding protein
MRRRDVLQGIAGLAAVPLVLRPLAAHAQPSLPVIGFLDSGSPGSMVANLAGFHEGLSEAGYIEGKNVAVEYRWAQGRYDQLPALAAELVLRPVAVIAATRTSAPAIAAKAATSTIPIVFQIGTDPVQDGLVASINRPGGNVTGATRLSMVINQKRLGVLSELVPKATAIGLLVNPDSPTTAAQMQNMQEATRASGLELHVFNASTDHDLDAAFAAVAQSGAAALVQGNDPTFIDRRKHIIALTLGYKIPMIFFERDSVVDGGLMSYSANFTDSFRQVGVYVGRILQGQKPADLPVLQPTRFELIINLKTAKALGLDIPPKLLFTADEVIE